MNTAEEDSSKRLKVSVIVPVYNVRQFLTEAIESVINQTYKTLEIILVDDGSTDGSGEICDQYSKKDNRVRVIHQKNQGLSAARNAGLDIMTGDVVAFLDSDDAFRPSFVEKMMEAMEEKEADIVLCKRIQCHSNGLLNYKGIKRNIDPTIAFGVYDRKSSLRALAEGTINAGVWNKIYRRELWNTVRFPEGHVYEDMDTTFRIIDLCRGISVLDMPLYMYRKRRGSITDTPSQKNVCDWIRSRDHFAAYIEEHIPEVFSQDQKGKMLKTQLSGMISFYGRYHKDEKNNKRFDKALRSKIISTGNRVNLEAESTRMRVLYFMMLHCPFMIRLVYHTVYPAWQVCIKAIDN